MSFNQGSMPALIELLEHIFEDLQSNISTDDLLRIAGIVYNAMTAHTRLFHNLDHVFNFTLQDDPVFHLAAVFHDIVYYQVDKGFYKGLEPVIQSIIQDSPQGFFIRTEPGAQSGILNQLYELFGLFPGTTVTIAMGLNEFLSACVMAFLLDGKVSAAVLLQAAVCIEATIPFRGLDEAGKTHIEVLEARLEKICAQWQICHSGLEIPSTLERAVLFSNKDVETFAEENVDRFLDQTWKLLPESNIALRSRGIYTIREYRLALQKMDSFLRGLDSQFIFSRYKNIPAQAEYDRMAALAQFNLSIVLAYLEIKQIAIAILESLAYLSGGDAPLSLFAGDLPRPSEKVKRLEDFLPVLPAPTDLDAMSAAIYHLLATGRSSDATFDSKNSPLSLFIYKSLSRQAAKADFQACLGFFEGVISPKALLARFPPAMIETIIRGCASLAYTRREMLLGLLNHKPV